MSDSGPAISSHGQNPSSATGTDPSPTTGSAPTSKTGGEYLEKLLRNIETMLEFANSSGITIPAELRKKLDLLMNDPEIDRPNSPIKAAAGWRGQPGR